MRKFRVWLLIVWVMSVAAPAFAASNTQARLLFSAAEAKPGTTITAGVELRMAPGWHTYWRNGGDSGMPTTIDWQLPDGFTAGEIQWPLPEKLIEKEITSYLYHDAVVLLVPIKIGNAVANGPREIRANVSWLECKTLCLPGSAEVKGSLVIGNDSKPSSDTDLLKTWESKLPRLEAPSGLSAYWDGAADDGKRTVVLAWNTSTKPEKVDFLPFTGDEYLIKGETETASGPDGVMVRKVVQSEGKWPSSLQGVLIAEAKAGAEPDAAYEINLPILESRQSAAKPGTAAPATSSSVGAPSLWLMLGFAFIGGLILNVMPCVLPVIALKILGFVNQSREEPRRVRQLGTVYGLGVLTSFVVLALLVIILQRAGEIVGWGVQFQNPYFLVAMTVLVLLVALNLFGVFEVTLGSQTMGAAGTLASKEGNSGAFFNGVLATILATPCSAPYLGYALGFAFAQPPLIILLMFMAIGLGLAAPFVILSWQPAWLKLLPKPGAWMERFKKAMGFPMLATAVWLFWLTLAHFDQSATLWLGIFLVVIALAAWIWGEFVQRSFRFRPASATLAVILVLGGYWFALEQKLHWRSLEAPSVAASAPAKSGGIEWQPWSPEAVQTARLAGHPVLVDFTAKWCVTCQWNKAGAIEKAEVIAKMKEVNAVAFRGDYSRKDPAIHEELKRHDRAGVPLNLVFPADTNAPPIVLPENLFILGPSAVVEALDKVKPIQAGPILSRKD